MSLEGQVDWKRRVVVVWAVAIIGADMAPAARAAPFNNPRRRGLLLSFIEGLQLC
jgi:hypothetical protein